MRFNIDDFIELDEEEFRSIEFDNDLEKESKQKIIEEMDQYNLAGTRYQLLFHEESDMIVVHPILRTLH